MPGVDIYRGTSNIALPAEVSEEIWGNAVDQSYFMQAARQIRIPGTGTTIQIIATDPEADWVDETEPKPVDTATFGKKVLTPYKLAVIEPFSNEFRRDLPGLYEELVRRLPGALAAKFDQTILGTTAPGTGFDVLGTAVTQGIAGDTFAGFVAADAAIATTTGGMMNHIGLSGMGRSLVLGATDQSGRPLFIPDATEGTVGRILGAPVVVNRNLGVAGTPNIVGIAGDFSRAVWGSVEGVKISVSDQATLVSNNNPLPLWQQNMFAVRAEIEIGFVVYDEDDFVLLTDDEATSA